MEEQMNELKWQRDLAQSQVENLLKSAAEERSSRMDEHSMLSSVDFEAYHRRRSYDSTDLGESSITNSLTERTLEFLENSEEDEFLLDDNTPQFSRHNLYNGWEETLQITDQNLEDVCKEVRCNEKSNGEAAIVESNESVDDFVDKKAVSEVLSPRKEETLSTAEPEESYKKSENEDMEISMPAEKNNVELSLKTIDLELCLNAKPETYEPNSRKSDFKMSQSVETQDSVMENEQMKKEESKMSPTKQVELCLNAKPETYELTLKNSDLEMSPSVEAQESAEEESKMSPTTNQADLCLNAKPETYELTLRNSDLEMNPSVEPQETQESVKEDVEMKEESKISPSTNQAELYLNAKPETYEQTSNNSNLEMSPLLEAQQTQEDEQMKKEESKRIPSTKQAEQCSNKEENDQSERQSKEDWELESVTKKKQPEETDEVKLIPDCVKLDEDVTSEEKQDNKLHQNTDRDYNESPVCKNIITDDVDNNTYLALQEKIKEMQKKIEYLMSMHTSEQHQSPSFRREYKSPVYFSRSQSCKENLLTARSPHWFENLEASNTTSPAWRVMELKASPGKSIRQNYNASSISFDSGSSNGSTSVYPRSLKDSDPDTGNSFHEFVAGLEEMVRQHSNDLTLELDCETSYTPKEIRPESPANSIRGNMNALPNPQNIVGETTDTTNDQSEREQGNEMVEEAVPKETYSMEACLEKQQVANGQYSSSDFERQQKQIIELWAVCNVPLVHRTYFFLLFKGDPSDYVYMEVELRRLSFLKQTISNDPETSRLQTVKTLIREREWLSKKIPRKFTRSQRIELYRKWGVEVNSKQRSLQVAHNLWTNTQDIEHIKESASLVAKLLGFVEQSRMPKEMFGLSLLTGAEDIKPSGWRFTKSFSGMRLTGL